MKRNKTILGTLSCIFMFSNSAFAHDCSVDGICYNLNDSDMTAEVTYQGPDYAAVEEYRGVINVPASIVYEGKEYSVTSIGDHAFYGCKALEEIYIPSGVTVLKKNSFESCYSLTNVVLPESLKEIGDYTFFGCEKLSNIILPKNLIKINEGVFSGCSSLTNIVLPESIQDIGSYAFQDCKSLTKINFPNALTKIGISSFANSGLKGKLLIPQSVTAIGGKAFSECTGLTHVETLATNLVFTYLGYEIGHQFEGCNLELLKIASTKYIPEGFCYGAQIKEIILPDDVHYISKYAFSNGKVGKINIPKFCTPIHREALSSVEELIIEDGDEYRLWLGDKLATNPHPDYDDYEYYYAFENSIGLRRLYIGRDCWLGDIRNSEHLTEVTIGPLVTTLREWRFGKATSLKTVISYATEAPEIYNTTFSGLPSDAVLYCPNPNDFGYEYYWKRYFSKVITIGTDIEEIENIETMETITTSTPIYDLQGRMVRPNSDTTGLPKGVYIVGGKKKIVK